MGDVVAGEPVTFTGSRSGIDEHGVYLLLVWHTSTQEIGVTIRADGLYIYAVNHDGSNYRSAIKHTWRSMAAWVMSQN